MVHLDGEAAVDDTDTGIVNGAEQDTDQNASQEAEASEQSFYPDDVPEGEQAPEDGENEGEEEGDEGGEPEIDVPPSLNAEERDRFKQLSAEDREFVASTIKRREDAAQQGVAKAVETQRAAERQAADHVATTKQESARQFAALVSAFAPQPPPAELARTSPTEYQFLRAQYEEQLIPFQGLVQHIQGMDAEATQHFETQQAAWRENRAKQLMADPEFAAAEDKTAYFDPIVAFGVNELGYDADGLVKDAEAQDIINIRRAMRWKEKAEKWEAHVRNRNTRPRKATGRFVAAAPAGGKAPASKAADPLKALYPND